MKLFIFLPIIAFYLYQSFKIRRLANREVEAFELHCDMYAKYRELMEDPLMSYLRWKEWLPVFEAADAHCQKLNPKTAAQLGRVSRFVKKMIEDDGYRQDSLAAR